MKKTEQEQEQPQEQAVAKSLTPIQRFQQNIEQYEQSVLPNLLKKHNKLAEDVKAMHTYLCEFTRSAQ